MPACPVCYTDAVGSEFLGMMRPWGVVCTLVEGRIHCALREEDAPQPITRYLCAKGHIYDHSPMLGYVRVEARATTEGSLR